MIEGLWSALAAPGSTMQPKMAVKICRDYLAASFGLPAKAAVERPAKRKK
jgi:hypothetical protein